jgi:uncharacterized protein (UPF0254 family)
MKRVYPSSTGQGKLFFDGGLSSKYDRSMIQDNESPDCLNVEFDDGGVGTRQGISQLNTTTVGTFACDGLFTRRADNSSETMVAFYGGRMYGLIGASTFTSIPSATSVFTAGVDVYAVQAESYLFVGNGSTPYKYNEHFTRHGIPAPASALSAISLAVGPLSGDYRYKQTYVNSASVEGDVSPVMATFTATLATIQVTLQTAPASYGVNTRRLYRTETSAAVYKLVATIANNTVLTYNDTTLDAALGTTAPTDQGEPPNWSVAVYHPALSRLFVNDTTNPTLLWYSEAGNPYVFKSTNFSRMGDISGDPIRSVVLYDNALVVYGFERNYVGYFPSNDPTEWFFVQSKAAYGSDSPYGNVAYADKVFFAAMEKRKFAGFADFKGTTIAPSESFRTVNAIASDLTSDKIRPFTDTINEALTERIYSIVYKRKIYVSVVYGDNETENNRILVYDFSTTNLNKKQKYSWVPWSGMKARHFTIYNGDLYFGSANAVGFVYKMFNGTYADVGNAIDSYFWTKEYSGHKEDTNYHKDFRFIHFLVSLLGAYNMILGYRLDSDVSETLDQDIYLDPGGSLWNVAKWGVDNWGGGRTQENVRVSLAVARGRRIQLKFSNNNTVNQGFKVQYATITYNLNGQR